MESMTNGTTELTPPLESSSTKAEKIAIAVLLSIIIILTVFGNLLVCIAVLRFSSLRQFLTNYFILSLAIADILVALLVETFSAVLIVTDKWIYGNRFCLIWISFDVMYCTSSILHFTFISYDRYSAICDPFVYLANNSGKRVIYMISFCWLFSFLFSFVPIQAKLNLIGVEKNLEIINEPYSCIFLVNKPFAVLASTVAFYIPCLLMVIFYLLIFREARRQALQIESQQRVSMSTSPTRQLPSLKAEKKAAKTLGIIIGCFMICWMPFFITNILDPFCNFCVPSTIWMVITWLGYTNSMLNPILYFCFNRKFRKAFLKILHFSICDKQTGDILSSSTADLRTAATQDQKRSIKSISDQKLSMSTTNGGVMHTGISR